MIGPGNDARLLAELFEGAGPDVIKASKPILKKATQNIKNKWQENLRASKFPPRIVTKKTGEQTIVDSWGILANSISYDDLSVGDSIRFELGSERGKAELMHISMGYTSRGGGHRTDPINYLDAEADVIEEEISKAVLKLIQ